MLGNSPEGCALRAGCSRTTGENVTVDLEAVANTLITLPRCDLFLRESEDFSDTADDETGDTGDSTGLT